MQQLQKTFEDIDVRIIQKEGEPWLVGNDVTDALGLSNGRDALSRLDDDEKGVAIVDTPGGRQKMTVINEAGAYRLVFTSRKKAAKRFKRWLAHEVLPSIRKHGSYQGDSAPASHQDDPILSLADATRQIRERQIQIEDRLDRLEEQTEQQERRRLDAQRQLKQLPPAEVDAPDKSDRAKLNEIVRAYVAATDSTYPSAWRDLYREIRYRLRIDVRKRAKNRGISKIEALDRDGLLPDAYAVARKVFGHALGHRL